MELLIILGWVVLLFLAMISTISTMTFYACVLAFGNQRGDKRCLALLSSLSIILWVSVVYLLPFNIGA